MRLIFTTPASGAVNRNTFNTRWPDALGEAGLPAGRVNGFHILRHTYASVLLAAGVDIKSVSEALGHASAAITLNVYAHMLPSAPDKMRSAIDAAAECAHDVRAGKAARR